MKKQSHRVFALLSDGECNEGSVWEAAMFAGAQQLSSLAVIVDYNKWQATGRSDEVMALPSLRDKWAAFGWDAVEVDGHNPEALATVFGREADPAGRPRAFIAHTVKGKGVSFMESELVKWHGVAPTKEQCAQAVAELRSKLGGN